MENGRRASHLVQGTFLPASKADDLAAMNKHADMRQCSADLQKAFGELQSWRRAVLREQQHSQSSSLPNNRFSQDVDASVHALRNAMVRLSLFICSQSQGSHVEKA